MKVAADRDTCIGAGMCVLTAPAVFDQDDDGIVAPRVEEVDADNAHVVRQAVELCPSGALRLLDE